MTSEIVNETVNFNRKLIETGMDDYSDKSKRDYGLRIKVIVDFLYSNFGIRSLLDYKIDELEQLFKFIESKEIIKDTKIRYRGILRKIILKSLRTEIANGDSKRISFYTYVFSDDYFSFSESGEHKKIFSVKAEELLEFISNMRKIHIRDYFIFSTMIYSACRASGVCNVRVKDLDFTTGTFHTIEKKTKKRSQKDYEYFLPFWFMDELKVFIQRQNLTQDDLLFNYNYQKLEDHLKSYRPTWRLHLFRHWTSSNWSKLGMSDIDNDLLINHSVSTYKRSLRNMTDLRESYDRFFPYKLTTQKEGTKYVQ